MTRIRFLAIALLVNTVLWIAPSRARAITYGFVDSTNAYPNVGAFIVKSNATGHVFPICSGTLIAPNVFQTAGHCTAFFEFVLVPNFTAWVSFDGSIPFGSLTSNTTQLIEVTHVVTNPNFNQRQSDAGDVGVLILGSSPEGISPATLPVCNLLDELTAHNGLKDSVFTAVGYGVQNRVVGGGMPFFQDMNPIPRMYAFSSFNALSPGYIRLSQNPSTGNGGTCLGDSGGPNFLTVDGQVILAAITITGDSVCRSTNVDYRLDLPSAQGFFEFVNATYGTAIPTSC